MSAQMRLTPIPPPPPPRKRMIQARQGKDAGKINEIPQKRFPKDRNLFYHQRVKALLVNLFLTL